MSRTREETARLALSLLDLTDLSDECTPEAIEGLTRKASTSFGPVAAVCIWPKFVAQAARALAGSPVRIATVVNFPGGMENVSDVIAMTEKAVDEGASEIDMVIPWPALVEGHPENVSARVARVRRAAGDAVVKAIIESGMLAKPDLIREATRGAIDGGADFVKTSTGKVPVNATPEAARIMMEEIKASGRNVGFKAAGGIRSVTDAEHYLGIADQIMGEDWTSPGTFRFGASGLLDDVIAVLEGRTKASSGNGY